MVQTWLLLVLLWAKPEKADAQQVHPGFREDLLGGGGGVNKKSGLSTKFSFCIKAFWVSLTDCKKLPICCEIGTLLFISWGINLMDCCLNMNMASGRVHMSLSKPIDIWYLCLCLWDQHCDYSALLDFYLLQLHYSIWLVHKQPWLSSEGFFSF